MTSVENINIVEEDTGAKEVAPPITRTVVTKTIYGGDEEQPPTVRSKITLNDGDAYDAALNISLGADPFNSSIISKSSNLDRAQDELNSYKKRIDANVEKQRQYSDMMANLQYKVQQYRNKFNDIENGIASNKQSDKISFNLNDIKKDDWSPKLVLSELDNDNIEFMKCIAEERRKKEDLYALLEGERSQNSQLQYEIEQLKRNLADKERLYSSRERNLTQSVNDERRKMSHLWDEMRKLKKDHTEYKFQAERALDSQRNEITQLQQNVARHLSLIATKGSGLFVDGSNESNAAVINQDAILTEAVKRFEHQQSISNSKIENDDLFKEIMKKYEESVERVIELESRKDDNAIKVVELEDELNRNKDRLLEYIEAIYKLHLLVKDASLEGDQSTTSIPSDEEAMQLSPSEVSRNVRNAIRNRDQLIQQLQHKMMNAETVLSDLKVQLEGGEEIQKRLDRQLIEAKRNIAVQAKSLDDANREIKRLEERLRKMECDKNAIESKKNNLDGEVKRLKTLLDNNSMDIEKKVVEDAEERIRQMENESKKRISELTHRIETLQSDNKQLRVDYNNLKDKYRSIDVEYKNIVLRMEEKDNALKNLDTLREELMSEIEKERERSDLLSSEYDSLHSKLMMNEENRVTLERQMDVVKEERDELLVEKNETKNKLMEVQLNLEIELRNREGLEKVHRGKVDEVEKLKVDLSAVNEALSAMRAANNDLDIQVNTLNAKLRQSENVLMSNRNEIYKLNELNGKLMTDKEEMVKLNESNGRMVDDLKNDGKRLELEVEKLRNEKRILEGDGEKWRIERSELLNRVRSLENELEEANREVRDMRIYRDESRDDVDKIKLLEMSDEELITKKDYNQSFTVNNQTVIDQYDIQIKQISDQFKLDLDKLQNEKVELEKRIRLLEDDIEDKQRSLDRFEVKSEELKRKYEMDMDRMKSELASVHLKYQNDIDDERNQHSYNVESMQATEQELRNKLTSLENKLKESINRSNTLEVQNGEWEEKCNEMVNEIGELRDEMENIKSTAEKEIDQWKNEYSTCRNELKDVEASNDSLKNQLNATIDKITSKNKTIDEQNIRIRELNLQMEHSKEELNESRAIQSNLETDLDDCLKRLNAIEEQYASLQLENSKLKGDLDSANRDIDMHKSNKVSNERIIERLKKKLGSLTDTNKNQSDELQQVKDERNQLEKLCREKTKQLDQLKELASVFDARIAQMRSEVKDANEKLMASNAERDDLNNELSKLRNELKFTSEQMSRKGDEFTKALDEVSNAHRISEDGRINAVKELDTYKYQINDLMTHLNSAQQRLSVMKQEYMSADNERNILKDCIHRYQSIINRISNINSLVKVEGGGGEGDAVGEDGVIKKETVPRLQSSLLSNDESSDVDSLHVNVYGLISRIDELERERDEYRNSLQRLKNNEGDRYMAMKKHETLYRSLEERYNGAEQDRKALEVRLATVKQLVKSQEETLKQRDDERQQLKSKIIAFELEIRGKDAQIRHLNELTKSLRSDIECAQSEVRSLRGRRELLDWSKPKVDNKVNDRVADSTRVTVLMSSFEAERKELNESIRKLNGKLNERENKNMDLQSDLEKAKRDAMRWRDTASELRHSLDEKTRVANDVSAMREQLSITRNELSSANLNKQRLESELMKIRSELHDKNQQVVDATTKVSDLQRQLSDAQSEKTRLNERIHSLEKSLSEERNKEGDLNRTISLLTNEKRKGEKEIEQLNRVICKFESDKQLTKKQFDELNRIRMALLRRVDLLTAEKQKAEAIVNETALQREAIERSLSALERENKELQKNSYSLQQQITQLEMDSGNRLMTITTQQRDQHNQFIQNIKNEKAEFERFVENRDRNQKNYIKRLESQLNALQQQLNMERARQRASSDQMIISDLNKSNSKLASDTVLTFSGSYHPQTSLDLNASHISLSPIVKSLRLMGNASPRTEFYGTRVALASADESGDSLKDAPATAESNELSAVDSNDTAKFETMKEELDAGSVSLNETQGSSEAETIQLKDE